MRIMNSRLVAEAMIEAMAAVVAGSIRRLVCGFAGTIMMLPGVISGWFLIPSKLLIIGA
jgi:hypothetical protein